MSLVMFTCVSQDSDGTYHIGVPKANVGTINAADTSEYSWVNFHCMKKGPQARKVVGSVQEVVALVNAVT